MSASPIQQQKLYILGEFYFKKGNFKEAKDIFTGLVKDSPDSFPFPYFLGKIESSLGNFDQAIAHLEKTRDLNPFHKPTLLLLSKCYLESKRFQEALECMVDSYLLCKETKDERLDTYKKKIRLLAKNLPNMGDKERNKLIKDRLNNLHQQLQKLEATLAGPPQIDDDPMATLPDIQTHDLNIEFEEPVSQPMMLAEPEAENVEEEPETPVEDDDDDFPPLPEVTNNVIHQEFGLENHPDIDFTKHILFKSLSVQEIEKIGKFSTVKTFSPGETIHQPLEPIYGFSCLLEGKVEILYQGQTLLELEKGSIIDEAELCNGDKYFFECKAVEPTTVFTVNKAALLTLCKRKHELAVHFLWHFYKSLGLKITSIMENIMAQNPSQDMVWSLDRMKEISQQRVLNELELDFLNRKAVKIIKSKKDFIYRNQDTTDFLYILLEGEIELDHPFAKDQVTLQPGEIFSEIALISNLFEHTMNAKVTSDHGVLLQISRQSLTDLKDPLNRDNYKMMEFLWNVFSKKYFEFLNFHYHLLKS